MIRKTRAQSLYLLYEVIGGEVNLPMMSVTNFVGKINCRTVKQLL